MLFKSLLVLAILVPCCSTAVLRGAAAGINVDTVDFNSQFTISLK
jgi:hypothetical protein